MKKTFRHTALECVVDLGVTVIYAAVVGVVIAAIVASDNGPASLVKAMLYASLLPASVALLILIDLALRLVADARAARRRYGTTTARST